MEEKTRDALCNISMLLSLRDEDELASRIEDMIACEDVDGILRLMLEYGDQHLIDMFDEATER